MKVAVLGPICKDRNIIAGSSFIRPGGVTYYTGMALARLSVETLVLGTCGNSAPEWPEQEHLRVERLPAAGTIEFVNEYDGHDRDNRRQRAVERDNALHPAALNAHELAGYDYIVLGPLLNGNIGLETVRKLAKTAPVALAAQGVFRYVRDEKIIWDNPEQLLELLPHCSLTALDTAELAFISRQPDLDDGAAVLLDYGAGHLVVTRGSRGSVLFTGGRKYEIPAFPPEQVADPTGAGDSYLAGYIRARDLYEDPIRRGRFAAMTATVSLESSGAFAGSLMVVQERLHNLQVA